jgi:hypothetical protein
MGSHSDSNYPSGFIGPSGSRKNRVSGQRGLPLGSIDGDARGGLRPDKLAVMVTNIESQRDAENTWAGSSASTNSSEERLTIEQPTPAQRKIEVGILQTFEVTQTSADGSDGSEPRRIVREHV